MAEGKAPGYGSAASTSLKLEAAAPGDAPLYFGTDHVLSSGGTLQQVIEPAAAVGSQHPHQATLDLRQMVVQQDAVVGHSDGHQVVAK